MLAIDGSDTAAVPASSARSRKWKCLLGTALIVCGGFLGWTHLRENWHAVLANRVYRSGQLSAGALEERIAEHGIRSIINLRGDNPQFEWYREERDTARTLGVEHHDFRVDSGFPPEPERLRKLIRLLDGCPTPLLVHCESGIDRSGHVAAVSVLLYDHDGSPEKALEQFGLRYGNLPWRDKNRRQRAFIEQYRDWLEEHALQHAPERFRRWADGAYVRPEFTAAD